jgi:hypothetical protein
VNTVANIWLVEFFCNITNVKVNYKNSMLGWSELLSGSEFFLYIVFLVTDEYSSVGTRCFILYELPYLSI